MAGYRLCTLMLVCILGACGPAGQAALPTAQIPLRPTTAPPLRAIAAARPTSEPTPSPTSEPTPSPTSEPTPADAMEQYRRWMAEARILHPYPESLETMWQVMICESSGNPELVASPYYGLFQYLPETWAGEWNPYRDQPILEPRAQIFATAKAWQDGKQGWWGCYR